MRHPAGVAVVLGLTVACGQPDRPAPSGLHVTILFAPSGKGDRSYNDTALEGLARAKERGVAMKLTEIQPARVADHESVLRSVASRHPDLVLAVGFLYAEAVSSVAPDFPTVRFAIVDADGGSHPNVKSLLFRAEEGCFLVGVIAARKSQAHKVGFIAGMDIPIMRQFECGFVSGVRAARAETAIERHYIGTTPDAFSNPARGKEIASLMYDRGADVVFHAAGASGLGVIQAASEKKRWVIGVDTDQKHLAPDVVLTSMRKRIDRAVEDTVREVEEGRFRGGTTSLGLREGGVDYVPNATEIDTETAALLIQLEEEIASGARLACENPRGAE